MRYILLSTIIFLFSCTQPLIESVESMKAFGLNMECKVTTKYEDKTFIKIHCFDLDLFGKVVGSDYWNKVNVDGVSIRAIFIDEDGFERYVEKIPVSSFANIVDNGDIQYQGTISSQFLTEEVYSKISKIKLGTSTPSDK